MALRRSVRRWGFYRVLWQAEGVKVKRITVNPHSGLSFQKHYHRGELWFVVKGTATIMTWPQVGASAEDVDLNKLAPHKREKLTPFYINKEEWHQLINETDEPLIIIEIQFGEKCEEDDIERLFYYE